MSWIDARHLDAGTVIKADVCIVGAGAAGITLARELAGTPARVALLESGGFRFRHGPQCLYRGRNTGLRSFHVARSRLRMFGGSMTRWAGQSAPLEPIDFEQRDWIPHSGWPFPASHLEPFHQRAAEVCRIGSYENDVAVWAKRVGPTLPVEGEGLQARVFQFGYPQDFGQLYRAELTETENLELYLNANVVEVELQENGSRVAGLQVATLRGRRFRAEAEVFVLAAGGIENPRLLLASNGVEARGIGNRHDLVGRFFMDHPYFFSGYFEPADTIHHNNLHLVEDYGRVGQEQGAVALFSIGHELMRREGLNNCGVFFIRRPNYKTLPAYNSPAGRSFVHLIDILKHVDLPDGDLGGHLRRVLKDPRSVERIVTRGLKERFRPLYRQALRAQLEPTPNPESRVLLGREKDRLGLNRVEVDWRLHPGDKGGLFRIHELLDQALRERGLGRLAVDLSEYEGDWPGSMSGGKHHMGTTRMHVDPRRGVVDPDGRVHGVSNLYVAGSSVFPTAGYANPTFTLVALALRLADHLKVRLET